MISKQSKFIKKWRKRWTVLGNNQLCTYKEEGKIDTEPTMNVHIDNIQKLESSDHFTGQKFSFDVLVTEEGKDVVYSFKCDNADDKNVWMKEIEKAREKRRKELELEANPPTSCCSIL